MAKIQIKLDKWELWLICKSIKENMPNLNNASHQRDRARGFLAELEARLDGIGNQKEVESKDATV